MWRLITASLLLLLALLTLFRAPTNFFWKTAIAIIEFPYLPLLATLLFFISCLKAQEYKPVSLILSGLAVVLYLTPIIRAYHKSATLVKELDAVFPSAIRAKHLAQPFSWLRLFSGVNIQEVEPHVLSYKENLTLDFYPAARDKAPCVIVVHGGSWAGGDSKQLPALNSYLANRGYHVAAINYRLAPAAKSPAQVQDTRAALAYLKKEAKTLHIDTTNFVLLGRSAGGQIALVAAYETPDPSLKGVIAMYSPADMVWGGHTKGNLLVLNTDKVFKDYLGGSIQEVPEKYKESSACDYVTPQVPPTLIIHGEIDAMVAFEHSRHLDKKLSENNVRHYFLDLPWATHGCDYNINGPSGQVSTYAIERFINSVTR